MAMSFIGRTLLTKPTSAFKSFSSSSLFRLRPLAATALTKFHEVSSIPTTSSLRYFSSRQTTSSLNDQSPNWNNRPPKETILLEGCDFEHWLIVVEKPEGDPTRDEIIDSYIKIAASILGSEEEARKNIYSVSTRHYWAFGIIVPEEVSFKFKELPNVRWVLPDSYLDVRNKDYGGEPFINGQAVPYDPKYHEEWVRNNAKANQRQRRDKPHNNFDRRNIERRRENMQNRDYQGPQGGPGGPSPNMGGAAPPPNVQHTNPNMGGAMPPPNVQHTGPNMGVGMPPPNVQHAGPNMGGGMPPPNVQHTGPKMGGGMPPPNFQNNAPNYGSVPPNANMQRGPPNYGGVPPSGNMQNSAPNYGGMPPNAGPNTGYTNMSMGNNAPNYGGMPPRGAGPNAGYPANFPSRDAGPNAGYPSNIPNAGNVPYSGSSNNMPYQSRDGPGPMPNRDYQNSYVPSRNTGNAGGNTYQVRDTPAGGSLYPNNDYQ